MCLIDTYQRTKVLSSQMRLTKRCTRLVARHLEWKGNEEGGSGECLIKPTETAVSLFQQLLSVTLTCQSVNRKLCMFRIIITLYIYFRWQQTKTWFVTRVIHPSRGSGVLSQRLMQFIPYFKTLIYLQTRHFCFLFTVENIYHRTSPKFGGFFLLQNVTKYIFIRVSGPSLFSDVIKRPFSSSGVKGLVVL